MNNCLILVDLQNDYFPGGNMELVGIEEAAANARILLNEFRKSEITCHPYPAHFHSPRRHVFSCRRLMGQKLIRLVTPEADEIVVVKNFPNSFRDTPLAGNTERRKNRQSGYLRRNEPHVYRRDYPCRFRFGFQLYCRRRCLRHKRSGFQGQHHKGVRCSRILYGRIICSLRQGTFNKRNYPMPGISTKYKGARHIPRYVRIKEGL